MKFGLTMAYLGKYIHLQKSNHESQENDDPEVRRKARYHADNERDKQRRDNDLASTMRIRQKTPQMRTDDDPRETNRTEDAFLLGGHIQVLPDNRDDVANAEDFQQKRGEDGSRHQDQDHVAWTETWNVRLT